MYFEITSVSNETVKAARRVISEGKDTGYMLIEGLRPVRDAIENGVVPEAVFASEKTPESDYAAESHTVYFVPPFIMEKLTDTRSPQSLCMTARRPAEKRLPEKGRYILCESIQDPKNLGAVIRTADALGLSGILLYGSCADPYSPKATRGSMASNLYLPVIRVDGAGLEELKKSFTFFAAVLDEKARPLGGFEFPENAVVAIGNEGKGVTPELTSFCRNTVYIPMKGRAQSLNAGAAAAVIMWEMSREKR